MRRGIKVGYRKQIRFISIEIAVLVALSLLIGNADALYDNIQNHPGDDLTLYYEDEIYTTPWEKSCAHTYGDSCEVSVKENPYKDTKVIYFYSKGGWAKIKNTIPFQSNYWSWTVVDGWSKYNDMEFYIKLYNSSNGLIDTSSTSLRDYVKAANMDRWEVLKSGTSVALYINGEYKCDLGMTVDEPVYYIELYQTSPNVGYGEEATIRIDDFLMGNAIIGTFPHNWTIKRNWDNPDTNGLYNNANTKQYTHVFHTTYAWRNVTSYSERNPPADSIVTKYFFTGEIVNITSLSSKSCGLIEFNFTDMLFHEDPTDDKYGLYYQELKRGTDVLAQDYFWFTYESAEKTFSGTISWDKDSYASGETARIHTNITNPDFTTYLYKGYVYDMDGNKEEEWTVSSTDEWHEVDLNGYDAGTYFAILRVRNKNTGFEWDEAYDIASISEEVRIEGVSYNAKNETILGNVYVNALQNYVDHETTTNATTGEYNISELCVDMEIQMNAAKTNYTHNNFSFTPLQNGLYNIDLFLLPDENHINITPPAIVGLVQSYPFYQNVSEATVNLWNTSIGLATSNTTNSMGYFEFTLDNTSMQTSDIINETFNSSEYDTWVSLANSGIVPYSEKVTNTTDETPYQRGTDYEMDYVAGKIKVLSTGNMSNNTDYHIDYEKYETTTYSINATKFKYEQMNQPMTFSVNATEVKYVYLLMNPIYNLTVRVRSADTHATIMEFNAMLNDGDVVQTTTGYINFSVNYGIHKVEVSADGYYPGISYVYVAEDTEKIIYLSPVEEVVQGGPGVYYAPHTVMFHIQDIFGNPISDVNVTAVGVQTTMGKWNWLRTMLGFTNESASEIQNTTMNGTTDTAGEITFLMVETIKYKINFNKTSQNINETIYIYPKEDRYTIVLGLVKSPTAYENININFSTSEVNSTHRFFNVSYQDLTNHTNHLGFYIYTKPLNSTGNVTELYNETLTGVNAYNFSYLALGWKGKVFYVKCNATYNDSYFEPVEQTKGYMYYLKQRLIDLGFDEEHDWYYNAIAVALLVLIAAMFSGITVKYGAVITPGAALGLWWIGWLSVPGAVVILPTAFVIGVLYYMSESAKEEGMT
ncbi:MAG: hypothetical protein DRP18_00340 [Candidatus Aenigmatarchaeota archaeon]|nr:MAG: hypothetical protein DRP18_00340 [Candidatus Aenigmarchaeota archaeon]